MAPTDRLRRGQTGAFRSMVAGGGHVYLMPTGSASGCSGVASGGQAGQLVPNLRSDTPWDRCRSEEIFMSEKNGVGLQDLLPRFTWTDATADFLWSYDYEEEGVVKVVEWVTLIGPQWNCGALWDLSVLALTLPSMTFFYFEMWIWAPLKK